MIKYLLTTSLFLFLVISLGCGPVLTIHDVGALDRNMSVKEVIYRLPVEKSSERTITIDSVNYLIWIYSLSAGQSSSQYLLVFKEEKLLFWGYPHEFARSTNPEINAIGVQRYQ